jgi:hypothetical protein
MKRTCVWPLCLGALLTCVPAKPQERTQVTLEDLVRASLDRNREVLALRQRVTQPRGLAQQAGVRTASAGDSSHRRHHHVDVSYASGAACNLPMVRSSSRRA